MYRYTRPDWFSAPPHDNIVIFIYFLMLINSKLFCVRGILQSSPFHTSPFTLLSLLSVKLEDLSATSIMSLVRLGNMVYRCRVDALTTKLIVAAVFISWFERRMMPFYTMTKQPRKKGNLPNAQSA